MAAEARQVKLTTLGLFILDTFEWRDGRDVERVLNRKDTEIGGGGTYAMIGARMWLPAELIGMVVDRGTDWSADLQARLDHFGRQMWYWRDAPRPTTRALNLYTGDHRDFRYLNERSRLEPRDLPPSLRTAEWLHFVCSPTRALTILSQLSDHGSDRPSLCYEPIPDRCCPEELDSLRRVLPMIQVFSPNHEEAAAFFGISTDTVEEQGRKGIEQTAERFFNEGAAKFVIIRSGALGAFAKEKGAQGFWVPAFHQQTSKVIDVTGGGNTFLGGLMAGLATGHSLREAVLMGSVSASFIIEQFGLAELSRTPDGRELWNSDAPQRRLEELRQRTVQ